MTLTIADEPSSDRMNPVSPSPSAAKHPAPSARISAIDTTLLGHGVDFSSLPRTKSDTAWIANTIRIENRTAVR